MTPAQQAALDAVFRFVQAINAADLDALRSLMSPGHTFTDALGHSFSGRDNMLAGWQGFFAAYPRYRIDMNETFTQETRIAIFGRASGGWRGHPAEASWCVSAAWLAHLTPEHQIEGWTVFCDTAWAKPPVLEP